MKMAITKVRSSSAQLRRSTGNRRKVVNTRLKEKFEPTHALADRRNEVRIGMRLKHARLSRGYTLKELAKIVECSESMISKVENDKLRPSIAMLHRFAQALETNIASLISEPDPNDDLVSIVRHNQRPRIHVDPELQGADVWLERVIPPSNGGLLQSHVLNLSPNGRSDGVISHTGEELGFVITGEVDLEVEGVIYNLQAGDSFFFASSLAHGYYNKGKKITRILWVNTPPSF
jgi:transcriptional regulator with XRE-family HTH domain